VVREQVRALGSAVISRRHRVQRQSRSTITQARAPLTFIVLLFSRVRRNEVNVWLVWFARLTSISPDRSVVYEERVVERCLTTYRRCATGWRAVRPRPRDAQAPAVGNV